MSDNYEIRRKALWDRWMDTDRIYPDYGVYVLSINPMSSIDIFNRGSIDATDSKNSVVIDVPAEIGGKYSQYKIGVSDKIRKRIAELQCGCPYRIMLVHVIETNDLSWLESLLHSQLRSLNTRNEWFHLSPEILGSLLCLRDLPRPRSAKDQRHVLEVVEFLREALPLPGMFGEGDARS